MKQPSRFQPTRRALLFWTHFIGLGAVAGTCMMLLDPTGKAMGMDAMLPYFQVLPFAKILFQDFTFSGIALLIVNGLTNLTAAALLLAKKASGCSSERRVRRDADALDLYPVLHVSAEFYVNRILLFRAHAGAHRLCGVGI